MKKQGHKNESRRLSRFASVILMLLVAVLCISSCGDVKDVIKEPLRTLEVPANLRLEGNNLCWNPVENATRYLVSINGKEYYSDDNVYSIAGISNGNFTFKVKAVGDSVIYQSSEFSAEYGVTLYNGEIAKGGYYSQFDELTKNESFLGYGFDVIRSSVFSDKYVKTSFPIFNPDELMNQRLLKVDSKYVYVDEIQSSSMDEFMSDWNVKANVNVSWGGKKIGGSVGVKANYEGGTERARSKYFHAMTFNNQEFYIVMQSDMQTLKSIISDSFKNDIYSDVEPSVFFDRYGTHFITSAVMGGRINSYYLYTSEEEKDFHDISAKVSVAVRYAAGKTNVSVSGGYRQEATSQNIDIQNTIEVIGGSDFGIRSDEDIAANYAAWEKSLSNHASLMGIKDTGSLIPVWELIDPALDVMIYSWDYDGDGVYETGSRSQQLQAYFMEYGTESYNDLMESSSLPQIIEPTEITEVLVNNLPANERGEYEVYAGVENSISFAVLPTDAVGYTKNVSLASTSDYARINENGQLVIDAIIPQNESVLTLVLSAGSARKQITVRIIRTYTVDFVTNSQGVTVDTLYNIREGSQIFEPEIPGRAGYTLAGWYTSADFNEESRYEFGKNAIMGHTTLYAKWEPVHPIVHTVSSIDGSVTDITVKFNTVLSSVEVAAPVGYNFGGFYKDDEFIDEWASDTVISTNITVYVKWTPKKYTVTFNTMGGSAVESQSIPYGEVAVLPEDPTKAGYTFAGWYSDSACQTRFDFYVNTVTQATTLYAGWVEFYPTVTVNSNIASNGATQWSEQIAYGKALSTVIMPEIQGYHLVGFYTTEQRLNEFDVDTKITEDVTVYAKYERNSYTVSFNSMGGSAVDSQSVLFGDLAAVPVEPTKAGYTFAGWYTDSKCENEFGFYVDVITETITLYAGWEEFHPTVTVKSNVATGTQTQWSQQIAYGKTLAAVTVPEITGYHFVGYYTTDERLNAFDMAKQITEYVTVYAKYEKNTYTVTFNTMGGTAVAPQNVLFGELAAAPASTTKAGYIFLGWYSDSKFENKFDFYVNTITEETTLYAAWVEFYPTVTVKSNVANETQTQWSEQIAYGKTLTAVSVPEITGYHFVGFYTTEERLNEFDMTAELTEDVTVYAKYEQNKYTVSYDTEGGSKVESETVTHGLRANEPKAPTKEGYTFLGWYTDIDFDTEFDFSRTRIESDVTVYAKWERFYPTVTFTSSVQDYVGRTESVNYGTVMAEPVEPSLRGHSFGGWYADSKLLNEFDFTQPIKEDTVIYLKWERVDYTVNFDSEGGSAVASQTLPFGSKITRPTTPTKDGYFFVGWNKEDGTRFDFSNMTLDENITLYAEWTQKTQVIVTFDSMGGSAHDSQNVFVNEALGDNLPIPEKAGYTFVAWYKTAEYLEADRIYANTTFAENTPLYAKWTANKYTVTLDAMGGTVTLEDFEVTFAGSYGENLPEPEKNGYSFGGWYTKAEGGNLVIAATVVAIAENHTLYAHWNPNSYTVKYDGNGETAGSTDDSTHSYDSSEALTSNGYSKTGHKFAGWNSKPDGTGVHYANVASVENLASTNGAVVTLYAQWTALDYTVTFDANGGSVTPASQSVKYNSKYGFYKALPEPVRTGYTFAGWYNGSVRVTSDTVVNTADDHTLTAKWTAITYVVTFDPNGGTLSVEKQNVDYDGRYDKYGKLVAPTRTGYTYGGWYYGDKRVYNETISKVASNHTLTAKWTAKNYTVTYNANGGTGTTASSSHTYGAAKALTKNGFTRTGYVFAGWATSATGGVVYTDLQTVTNVSSTGDNITLYAVWKYTVVYNGNGATSGTTNSSVHYYDKAQNLTANGFAKTGYVFNGWNTKADGTGTAYTNSQSVKNIGNVTLYAQWKYTITYNANGGTGSTAASTHYYGKAKNLTANGFAKTGYVFNGWNTKADGTGTAYTNSQSVTNVGNITLYAQWKYTIIYNGNDATSGSTATSTHFYNVAKNLTANGFVKTGYVFGGWNTKKDGTGTAYTNSQSVKNVTPTSGSVTLYAQWKYTVTYNGNDATSGSMSPSTHYYGKAQNLTANGFTKTGYIFNGWNTKKDGTGTAYTNSQSVKNLNPTNGNITLYAQWKYTIKYNGNGATSGSMADSTHFYNVAKKLTANGFTRNGYTFAGWATSASGSVKYTNNQSIKNIGPTNGSITLYAVWKVDPYTISKYASYTNGQATVKDTDGANTYTIYNTINSTPPELVGNVILDWSGEKETDMLKNVERKVRNDSAGNPRYNNIDLSSTAKNIYFIGDASKTYTNLCLHICNFKSLQALKLSFTNFKYVSNETAICTWNNNGETANLVNLTIEVRGTSSISTSISGRTAISIPGTVNFTGSGTLTVKGGDGADGYGGAGPDYKESAEGKDGGIGVKATNVVVNMNGGTLNVYGGNGGAAYNRATGDNGGNGSNGRDGYRGGDGGIAIVASNVTLQAGKLNAKGGNGGEGGDASEANAAVKKKKGGRAGDGGNGAVAISATSLVVSDSSTTKSATLTGGNGGNTGRRGGHHSGYNGSDGDWGTVGSGAKATSSNCVISGSTTLVKSTTGNNGTADSGVNWC